MIIVQFYRYLFVSNTESGTWLTVLSRSTFLALLPQDAHCTAGKVEVEVNFRVIASFYEQNARFMVL